MIDAVADDPTQAGPGESLSARAARLAATPPEPLAQRAARLAGAVKRSADYAALPETTKTRLGVEQALMDEPPAPAVKVAPVPMDAVSRRLIPPGSGIPTAASDATRIPGFDRKILAPAPRSAPGYVAPVEQPHVSGPIEKAAGAVTQVVAAPFENPVAAVAGVPIQAAKDVKLLVRAASEQSARNELARMGKDPDAVPRTYPVKDVALAAARLGTLALAPGVGRLVSGMLEAAGLSAAVAGAGGGAVAAAPVGAAFNPEHPIAGAVGTSLFGGVLGAAGARSGSVSPKATAGGEPSIPGGPRLGKPSPETPRPSGTLPMDEGVVRAPSLDDVLAQTDLKYGDVKKSLDEITGHSTEPASPKDAKAKILDATAVTKKAVDYFPEARADLPIAEWAHQNAHLPADEFLDAFHKQTAPPAGAQVIEPAGGAGGQGTTVAGPGMSQKAGAAPSGGGPTGHNVTLDAPEPSHLESALAETERRGPQPPKPREYVPESSGLAATEDQMATRNIARALKTANPDAIAHAAPEMAQRIPPNAILVPLPDHQGNTTANAALAASIAQQHGQSDVADVLTRTAPSVSAQESRQSGKLGPTAEDHAATIGLKQGADDVRQSGRPVVLIDNVETTGATAEGARRVLGTGADLVAFAKAPVPVGEEPAEASTSHAHEIVRGLGLDPKAIAFQSAGGSHHGETNPVNALATAYSELEGRNAALVSRTKTLDEDKNPTTGKPISAKQRAHVEHDIAAMTQAYQSELSAIEATFGKPVASHLAARFASTPARAAAAPLPSEKPSLSERAKALTAAARTKVAAAISPELAADHRSLSRAVNTDALTGLGNQRAYGQAVARAEADPDTSVIRFDLNGFKAVNDVVGHAAGDAALKAVAAAIHKGAPGLPSYRVGGDEFAVLASKTNAETVRDAIEKAVGVTDVPGKDGKARYSISGGVGATDLEADAAASERKKAHKMAQGIGGRGESATVQHDQSAEPSRSSAESREATTAGVPAPEQAVVGAPDGSDGASADALRDQLARARAENDRLKQQIAEPQTRVTSGDLADELDPIEEDVASDVPRPRTAGGVLKNLQKATDEEIRNEYRILVDLNAHENTVGYLARDENFHTMEDGRSFLVTGEAAAYARGRVKNRQTTIAKLEAEMTTRGMDHAASYIRSAEDLANQDPTEFKFGEKRVVYSLDQGDLFTQAVDNPTGPEAQALQRDEASKAYGSVAKRDAVARELAPLVAQMKAAGHTLAEEREAFVGEMQAPAWANLAGVDVSTPDKLRAALSVMRHPLAESMSILFKNTRGEVVDHFVYSSGALNTIAFDNVKMESDITARAKALGVRTVTIAHNHPSGDPSFSDEDAAWTLYMGGRLQSHGIVLDGHMTIDHDTANWVTPNPAMQGKKITYPRAFFTITLVSIPGVDSQAWTTAVQRGLPRASPENVAATLRDAVSPAAMSVVYLDAQHRILAVEARSIHEPVDALLDHADAQRRKLAAYDVLVAGSSGRAAEVRSAALQARNAGQSRGHYVTDVIIVTPDGSHAPIIDSSFARGLYPSPDRGWRDEDDKRAPVATRVSEPGVAAGRIPDDGQSDPFGIRGLAPGESIGDFSRRLKAARAARYEIALSAIGDLRKPAKFAGDNMEWVVHRSARIPGVIQVTTLGRDATGAVVPLGHLEFESIPDAAQEVAGNPHARPVGRVSEGEVSDRVTDTPAFSKWFGDSKVVDAEGKPLVVYHGTTADFDTFQRMNTDVGFHAGSTNVAHAIFDSKTDGIKSKPAPTLGRNVMPLYMRIEKPLRTRDLDTFNTENIGRELERQGLVGDGREWAQGLIRQGKDAFLAEIAARFPDARTVGDLASRGFDRDKQLGLEFSLTARKTAEALEAMGYDGIVYDNQFEGGGDSWVAFQPEQIKSASGNSGAFDSSKSSIVAERGPKYGEQQEDSTVGVKNAASAETRELFGMDERTLSDPRTQDEMYDAGKVEAEANPDAIPRLLAALHADPERIVGTKVEAGLLLKYRVDLDRDLNALVATKAAARAAGDIAAEHVADVQLVAKRADIRTFVQLAERTGTATGRALAARRMISMLDYSLSGMESTAESAKGEPLTSEENARIQKLHDELVARLAAVQADASLAKERAAKAEADLHHAELKLEAAGPILARIQGRLGTAADAAKERIRARGLRAMSGIDPELLLDYAIAGAAEIANGAVAFIDWADRMRAAFGDEIIPHLDEIHDASNKYLDEETNREAKKVSKTKAPKVKAPTDIRSKMAARVDENIDDLSDLQPYLRQLALEQIRAGNTTREGVLDSLLRDVQAVLPDVSREDVRDALSGYGQFTPLNKATDEQRLREIRAESQKLAQLEALARGEALLATGRERPQMNDETRRLGQQVAAAKKAMGIGWADDATRLKSALSAAKTRTRNAIKDLQSEIDTGERIVKGKPKLISDAELAALKTQLAELRKAASGVFVDPGLTDEQRLARAATVAKRTADAWDARVEKARSGSFDGPASRLVASSPELDALRAHAKTAREEYEELKSLDPAQRQLTHEKWNQQYRARLANREAELLGRIARADYGPRTPRPAQVMDEDSRRALAALEEVKGRFRAQVREYEQAKRPGIVKAADYWASWVRGAVLTSPAVFIKLFGAAAARFVSTPLEQAVGYGISQAIPRLASQAPRHGVPTLSGALRAEAASQTRMWTEGVKGSVDLVRSRRTTLDLLHDPAHTANHFVRSTASHPVARVAMNALNGMVAMSSYVGQLHAAMKNPIFEAEYARSYQLRTEHALAHGENTADQITHLRISNEAYLDAKRAIFKQDNRILTAEKVALRALESPDKHGKTSAGGVVIAAAIRTELPIVRIPTNFAHEIMEIATGLPVGAARIIKAYHADARFRRGGGAGGASGGGSGGSGGSLDDLDPIEADAIMRQLKKGMIGAALMALGFFGVAKAGGLYLKGAKRKPQDDPQAGDIGSLKKAWLHNPFADAFQIGATTREVGDSFFKKTDTDPQGYSAGLMASAFGILDEVPFIRETSTIESLIDERTRAGALDTKLAGLAVPIGVQWIAKQTDIDSVTQKPTLRNPTGLTQHLEANIPRLRQNVPERTGPEQERTSAQNKMAEFLAGYSTPAKSAADVAERAAVVKRLQRGNLTLDSLDAIADRGAVSAQAISTIESRVASSFIRLSLNDARRVYALGQPWERELWKDAMDEKESHANDLPRLRRTP